MILRNFISPRAFTVYVENSLRFEISLQSIWPKWNLHRSDFHYARVMWTLIMKLPHTEVKFYPEVKSQTGLSSVRVSCKRALRYLAPKTWNIIPLEIRNSGSLIEFITNIKSGIPKHYPCTLCRICIHHVGYID